MKKLALVLLTTLLMSGFAKQAFAGMGCWSWTPDLNISSVLLEDTADGKLMARIVTTQTVAGINQFGFYVVNGADQAKVGLLQAALANNRKIAIRWSDHSRCPAQSDWVVYNYSYAAGASTTLTLDRAVGLSFRNF